LFILPEFHRAQPNNGRVIVGVKKLGSWVWYGSTARMYVSALTSQRVSTVLCGKRGVRKFVSDMSQPLCGGRVTPEIIFSLCTHLCDCYWKYVYKVRYRWW